MDSRAALQNIRIVNVTKEGRDASFSSLGDRLKKLPPEGFVAVDTEFSGLGSDPHLSHEDLNLRYEAIRRLSDTRAIFAVGIAVFHPVQDSADASNGIAKHDDGPSSLYEVATYDFLMCCQDDFQTDANAGAFLVAHNFDFNRMFQKGIPYHRASTERPPEGAGGKEVTKEAVPWRWGKMPRGLLWRIGRQGVPIVVHNGLFDLAFLFAAFQGPLPPTLNGFVGALLDCVPAGYWDSKILAGLAEERASFLGYMFANAVLKALVSVRNASGLPRDEVADPPEEVPLKFANTLCALYSFRGFCPRGVVCPFLHDPFLVVEAEKKDELPKDSKEAFKRHKTQSKELKRRKGILKAETSSFSKKQKRKLQEERIARRQSASSDSVPGDAMVLEEPSAPTTPASGLKNESKVHTAGWDAFCTGYVFAVYREDIPAARLNKERNKVALQKKSAGLLLCKSKYADLDNGCATRHIKKEIPGT